jgi:malate dehydrogenase (oxaloacetate-decarboxylating)
MPLSQHRIVILGAGAAGVGIARLVREALHRAGLQGHDLRRALAVLDAHGLVVEGEGPAEDYRRELAWPHELAAAHGLQPGHDLLAVVRALHPSVLIGVSGATGAFTESVVREMAAHVQQPLVFPLSNPTSQAEASPADVVKWTEGRALVATGSPFPSVIHAGRTRRVGQGNNVFVFPGIGLGAMVAEAREITDGMFRAAAERLADEVSQEDLEAGALYPPIAALRRVTAHLAEAVVRQARADGVAPDLRGDDVPRRVGEAMWEPHYIRLVPA